MSRYQIHAATLHTTDLNAGSLITLGGETSMELNTGTEVTSDDSGTLYDEVVSMVRQMPDARLITKSIAQWLTYIGLAGYCIASDGSHPGLRLYCSVLNDCKNPPAATDNLRYTIAKGLVILGQLQANRGQDATLTFMVHALSDGTNAPISGTYTGITLPTVSTHEQFELGACKFGNVTLSDLASLTIDFGVQITAKTPEMGSVWPESIAVRKIQPIVTLSGFNPTVLDNTLIPLAGKQASHAQTILQLKKRAAYSTFVADGTAQHIRLTVNGMAYVPQAFSGSGNAEVSSQIIVRGVHDGTNVPILFNLASTYTPTP